MRELTEPQRQALDAAIDVPARTADPLTGAVEVLLSVEDFDWIRALLGDEPDAPRAQDPRTSQEFVLLPETRYERFKAFFEEDPLTSQEQAFLLREAGRRAGWDDPIWNGDDKEKP
jgi:hypothetical protein